MLQSPLIPELQIEELPDKPSELLELALNDFLEVTAQTDKYTGTMNVWYDTNGTCSVCLAGAIFAKRSTIKREMVIDARDKHLDEWDEDDQDEAMELWEGFSPGFFDYESCKKLEAINDMRLGRVGYGFAKLDFDQRKGVEFDRDITRYEENEQQFLKEIKTLISDLKAAGY